MVKGRFLPIGIQTFSDIRERNAVYADKTAFVYKLATEGKPYFLSRPRRFGKSLFLSTLEAYFLGKKELFTGLAIEELEKDWTVYPVLKISFGGNSFYNTDILKSHLNNLLSNFESDYNIAPKEIEDFGSRLANLISTIYKKTKLPVVILIDEYDKPVLDALYTEYENQNRDILRAFYSPLKDSDCFIKFLFITGITRISHMNTFSGLNQLNDISLNSRYASICGISESELDEYFTPEIEELARVQEMSIEETKAELAKMYDGYYFTQEREGVYNPFCLLKCFSDLSFGSYWFESGTPSFLIKTLQNQPFQLISIMDGRQATESQFKDYDPDSKNMFPVIYQSGYLTIKGFEETDFSRIYTLGFPNKEVEDGLLNAVLPKFLSVPDDDLGLSIDYLRKAFAAGELDYAMRIIKACFSDIPTIVQKNMCENFYEAITHVLLRMTGFDVVSEMQSIFGRSDIILSTQTDVYIFELKTVSPDNLEKGFTQALEQIDKKDYAKRYSVSGKTTHKVALVFCDDAGGVLGWKEE